MADNLDPAARAAIDARIFKWFLGLGIANFSALMAALVYIFFILPHQAVQQAIPILQTQAEAPISQLRDKILTTAADALYKSGQASSDAERAVLAAAKAQTEINTLQKSIRALKETDQITIISEALEGLGDKSDEILEFLTRLKSLEEQLKEIKRPHSYSEAIAGQEYIATTLGFVVVRIAANTSSRNAYAEGIVNGKTIASASAADNYASEVISSPTQTFTMPVPNGARWKIQTNSASLVSIQWFGLSPPGL